VLLHLITFYVFVCRLNFVVPIDLSIKPHERLAQRNDFQHIARSQDGQIIILIDFRANNWWDVPRFALVALVAARTTFAALAAPRLVKRCLPRGDDGAELAAAEKAFLS
jgi:hypothetical protein